jgi:hypothetical protein
MGASLLLERGVLNAGYVQTLGVSGHPLEFEFVK